MKKNFLFVALFLVSLSIKAQDLSSFFVTYTPVETPRTPVYVTPFPNIIDNSVTIINNSYRQSTPSVKCVESKTASGQLLMFDTTNNYEEVVSAEVLFKCFSDNSASVTITKIQIDKKWYPVKIEATRLKDLLDIDEFDRQFILDLLKNFNFIASSEEVLFLF